MATPRLAVIGGLAALLAAPVPAASRSAPGEARGESYEVCPFFAAKDAQATMGVPLSAAHCKAAKEFDAIFRALREVADIQESELSFSRVIKDVDGYNAYYMPQTRQVIVTMDFLACHGAVPRTAAMVLAHEIGHAVQDKYGQLRNYSTAHSRQIEGQADDTGRALLAAAKFPVPLEESWEMLRNCTGMPGNYYSNHSHPDIVVRWNAAAEAERRKSKLAKSQADIDAVTAGLGLGSWRGFGALTQGDSVTEASRKSPYRINAGDFQPPVALAQYDNQGLSPSRVTDLRRMRQSGVPDPFVVPMDNQNRKSVSVSLPDQRQWYPPYSPLTPAEMLIFATRHLLGKNVTDMEPAEAFRRALDYIMRNQAWELLPGTVLEPVGRPLPRPVEMKITQAPRPAGSSVPEKPSR